VANKGVHRFSGNAETDCRTEAAALVDLHGSSGAGIYRLDCIPLKVES
jgi:hypothetical protein